MTIKLVTFDLNKAGQNYQNINEAIKSYGDYKKIATTTYAIKTSQSSGDVRDTLKKHVDSNDKIFVSTIDGWGSFNLPADVTDWLKN